MHCNGWTDLIIPMQIKPKLQIILSALAAESDTNGANPEQKKENKSSHTFCYSDALFVIEYDDFFVIIIT